jgi:FkbM family methyltransferase
MILTIVKCIKILLKCSTIPKKDIFWIYFTIFRSVIRDPKVIFNRQKSKSTHFLSDYLPRQIVVKTPSGILFLARPKYEDLARYLFAEIVAKWEPLKILKPKKNDIVIDIGANTGYYSLRLSSLVGKNGKIIAIEPDPQTFDTLTKNCKLNNISNVNTHNIAISDSKGEIIFHQSIFHSGTSSMFANENDKSEMKELIIKTTTLDELVKEKYKQIAWIKIDVEGAELEVLKGSSTILSKTKNIIIEVHEHILNQNNKNSKEILEILEENGFKITLLNDFWDEENSPNQILKSDYILGQK